MKKFFLVCLTAFLMLAAGCSSGGKALSAQDIDFTFSCKVDVSSPVGNYSCAFSRAGMENASVEIISGNGNGLKWYWNGGNFNQTYCGLSAGSENCVLPCNSFALMLVKTVDGASQPGALKKAVTMFLPAALMDIILHLLRMEKQGRYNRLISRLLAFHSGSMTLRSRYLGRTKTLMHKN